ncbi:NUDIX domain-containing protein [Bacillus sp. 165]|uniref:NUDIX domain-containing protein n=1 Tax=Bacillus sp. 165 TaxID=1529117 RepID=UPI001ADC0E68|nr:NUDIX domain-containing protein [Bacillus sp. 165]MBO9130340.1 NUDIX domain-containing protein [Bacillus sp. 165]
MKLKTVVKAWIVQDDKVLTIKKHKNGTEFYVLPGGKQKKKETMHEALQRECKEEAGAEVVGGELLSVWESFDEDFHKVVLLFSAQFIEMKGIPLKQDADQIGIEWLPIASLHSFPFYPKEIIKQTSIYIGTIQ